MNNRFPYLDILKGLGIFFVVFGHITHINILREYIWSFHMPLFFFISGFLHNSNSYFKEFLKKKIKSLYIPYILFFFITFLYWIIIERHVRGGEYSIFHQLIGLPYGTYEGFHLNFNGALWFLPCLFVTELLFFPLGKMNNKININIILLFSYIIGTLLKQKNIDYLPFGLHTAFFSLIFYGFGYSCKDLPNNLLRTPNHYQWLLIILCFLAQILNIQYSTQISKCTLPYLPLSIIGILLYLMLSIKIRQNKIIEFIGKNSIIIFAFQEPVYRAIIFIFSKILNCEVELLRNNIFYSLLITFASILIITPSILIYNKFIKYKINNLF